MLLSELFSLVRAYILFVDLFCSGFRISGESQKILRDLEPFGVKYLKDNPGSFEGQDDPAILAYSLIMVNAFRNKPDMMNKNSFIEMNDVMKKPNEYLSSMYDRMMAEEVWLSFLFFFLFMFS
jgi:brefeldin A-inhibited guanine nucleotide-exchange protein